MAGSVRRLFDAVTHATDADGRVLCEDFLELPDKALMPAYYENVESPICLADIANRVYPPSSEEFSQPEPYNLREIRRDLRKLVTNAKKASAYSSPFHRDAMKIEVNVAVRRRIAVARLGLPGFHPRTDLCPPVSPLIYREY